MPRMILTHEVDDVAHWLASPKRDEAFAGIARNMVTCVHPTEPNRVALSLEIIDMDAFDAMMKSDVAADAMKHDGVRPDTVAMYIEG